MSESIVELARIEVQAISVKVRPDPNALEKIEELMLQTNADGTVQVDVFRTDLEGKALHESRALGEEEYERLRQSLLVREMATLPPFSSFKSGNTLGRVVGETAPAAVPAAQANPPIEAGTEAEGITGEQVLDGIQIGLDVVGLVPVFGEIADVANAGVSLARGDYVGAGLSLASAIPFVGWFGTAGKAARYGTTMVETSGKAIKEAADKGVKEAAGKKAKNEIAQKERQGAKFKPRKLPKVKPKCFDPRQSKKYKNMNESDQKSYLKEYAKQLKRQEDAINNMSAKDFANASRKFKNEGRNPAAQKAQEAYRSRRTAEIKDSLYESSIRRNPNVDPKVSEANAATRAKEVMESLAALHEPDMVAGGWHRPEPSGLGGRGVNSAIGGSWGKKHKIVDQKGRTRRKSRANLIEDSAKSAISDGDGSEMMNVELTICPPGKKGK